jgi:transposase
MLYFGLHWSEQLRVAPAIELTEELEGELTRLARSKRISFRLAQRARVVVLAAQGLQNKDIAQTLGIGRVQVARWRERYLESGVQGIERDLPRGAPPVKVDVARLMELTTQSTPEAATHWSTCKMAAVLHVSPSTVMRHWQANGLKPHLVHGFKISRDPKFALLKAAAACRDAPRNSGDLCQH